jgi:hypothetical protein
LVDLGTICRSCVQPRWKFEFVNCNVVWGWVISIVLCISRVLTYCTIVVFCRYWVSWVLSFVLSIVCSVTLKISGCYCIKIEAWTPQSTPGGRGHWRHNIWIRGECSVLSVLKEVKVGRSCSTLLFYMVPQEWNIWIAYFQCSNESLVSKRSSIRHTVSVLYQRYWS